MQSCQQSVLQGQIQHAFDGRPLHFTVFSDPNCESGMNFHANHWPRASSPTANFSVLLSGRIHCQMLSAKSHAEV